MTAKPNGAPGLRVLVVDDSPTVRAVLRRLLARTHDLTVVAEAGDGAEAVELVRRLEPDVVLMDVEMPQLDGWAATEQIMRERPTPVLVLSSRVDRDQQQAAFRAMRSGALDVVPKPIDTAGWELLHDTLPQTVRAAAQRGRGTPAASVRGGAAASSEALAARGSELHWVAIGASTGGPPAVRELLEALPTPCPVRVVIVQHIAAGFEEAMVEWLARDLGRDIRLADDGEEPRPGSVRFAPAGAHLRLSADGSLRLDRRTPPRSGHRPSVDELFFSCARNLPQRSAGVLLSGMGSDGAAGLLALRRAGGLTVVQDAASSAIWGMPRAALDCGAADLALSPREIGRTLVRAWEVRS